MRDDNEQAPRWLRQRIEASASGALSLGDYFALSLTDPKQGYYATRHALGRGGDFVTAPEVSPLFGEMVGLWLLSAAEGLGLDKRKKPILIEAGGGRGHLMRAVLRAFALRPRLLKGLHVHAVEPSLRLRKEQAESITGLIDAERLQFHDDLATVPQAPFLFVANEFFDALPVEQIWREKGRWVKRAVGLDPKGRLRWMSLPCKTPPKLTDPDGVEISPHRDAVAKALGARLAAQAGAVLVIDYGYSQTKARSSLQALHAGAFSDPLQAPGLSDLSADVDFSALARSIGTQRCAPMMTQGDFLLALGIAHRLARLKAANPEQADALAFGVHRLVSAREMGRKYKVLAAASEHLALPPWPMPCL